MIHRLPKWTFTLNKTEILKKTALYIEQGYDPDNIQHTVGSFNTISCLHKWSHHRVRQIIIIYCFEEILVYITIYVYCGRTKVII
jgi:hypothetical protein